MHMKNKCERTHGKTEGNERNGKNLVEKRELHKHLMWCLNH